MRGRGGVSGGTRVWERARQRGSRNQGEESRTRVGEVGTKVARGTGLGEENQSGGEPKRARRTRVGRGTRQGGEVQWRGMGNQRSKV